MRHRFMQAAGTVAVVFALTLTASAQTNETYRQLELFGDIFERVRADYVDEKTDEELVESAINGMLHALDPHSTYLNEKNFRNVQVQARGEFGGLGIEVTMEQGLIKVVSPIDGTPAAAAGLQAGDLISHLDGKPVLGLTLSEAVERMRGPVNSDILLTIRREQQEPFDVTITRNVIKIQSVRSNFEGEDILYVRVTTFNEQTYPGLERALTEAREEADDKLTGVVIDLRNNPGGLLDQAVKVSDAFLDRGEVVSTRGRRPEDASRYNATRGDLAEGLPIVVLINRGSASASEIVAGALQDHRRAVVMGTRSFGKGSVQKLIAIPGHGAMRLTTSRYYTPSGRSIQVTGITPDIEVEQARIEVVEARGRLLEGDLPNALSNEAGEDTAAEGEAASEDVADYQLARAVDLLRGIALYRSRAVN